MRPAEGELAGTHGDGMVLSAARCARVRIDDKRYLEPIPEDELHLTKTGAELSAQVSQSEASLEIAGRHPRTAYRLLPMS
ncbi:hypothetical protein GCM10009733_019240 [Nonomuraea maheshkhaliensis]|uniref:Uncharacterized protein n=1 Tax=Nonomuraea maheshkhaliensis TaxID=419590 RepID=A0ABP4QW57_9ACTN